MLTSIVGAFLLLLLLLLLLIFLSFFPFLIYFSPPLPLSLYLPDRGKINVKRV